MDAIDLLLIASKSEPSSAAADHLGLKFQEIQLLIADKLCIFCLF